jgi:hypothetical protein
VGATAYRVRLRHWVLLGGVMMPGSSFRLADGQTEISQTFEDAELISRDGRPIHCIA